MKPETIERLLALNAAFYQASAEGFSATRRTPWPGWTRLLDRFRAPISVLDLGCGNGRFFAELGRRGLAGAYLGVDTSEALIAIARRAHPEARFERADALAPAAGETFELCVAFGLLHHLPSFVLRERFVRSLGPRMVEGGTACLTFWRFAERARFERRIAPWDPGDDVEPGDHLLRFGGDRSLRYCHHASDAEIDRLVTATGLKEVDRYAADGETEDLNLYSVLVR